MSKCPDAPQKTAINNTVDNLDVVCCNLDTVYPENIVNNAICVTPENVNKITYNSFPTKPIKYNSIIYLCAVARKLDDFYENDEYAINAYKSPEKTIKVRDCPYAPNRKNNPFILYNE